MRRVIAGVISLLLVMLMGCDSVMFGERTTFAAGYSDNRFQLVTPGMTPQEVVSLLGDPLMQTTQQWSEVWSYWPASDRPTRPGEDNGTITYSLFGSSTHLGFNELGVVATVSGDFLDGNLVGLTKAKVQSEFGKPSQVEENPFKLIYHYTAAHKSGSGTYNRREIHFDASYKVSSTVAKMYYD